MWGALAGGALGAAGSIFGEKAKDESELLREEPPERKYANSMMQLISARALSGKKSAADLMEEARMRTAIQQQQGQQQSEMLRRYGMMGAESPGMMNRLTDMGTSGITGIINALNQANLERRQGALNMLPTLLNQNQPYEKEEVTEGPMWAKALSGAATGLGSGLGGMKAPVKPTAPTGTSTQFNPSSLDASQLSLTGNQGKRTGLYRFYEGIG